MGKDQDLNHIIIETQHSSNLLSLQDLFSTYKNLMDQYQISKTIVLVDAQHLSSNIPTSKAFDSFVQYSDLILINKKDLCEASKFNQVKKAIKKLDNRWKLKIISLENKELDVQFALEPLKFRR